MAKSMKKSAFVAAVSSNQEALVQAANTERASMADASEVIQVYGLDDGDRISVPCKLAGVKVSTHEEGDKKGLPYVNWVFAPTTAPGKGMMIGNFQPCYDRKTLQVDGKALGWIFQEFQACGFDTKSWGKDPSQIEDAATELDKEKPNILLSIRCTKLRAGVRSGQLVVNYNISRIVDEQPSSQEDQVEDLAEELDEAMEAPAPIAAKVSKAKPAKPSHKVGGKVKFNFVDDDGNEEVLDGTIEAINGDVYSVTDGTYSYELELSDFVS